MNGFRMYGKHGNQKRFKAMDMTKGVQVETLIHATIYPPEKEKELRDNLSKLHKANPEWTFEVRPI